MAETTQTMADMPVGAKGVVRGYSEGGGAYRARLLAMGLTKGTHFEVKRVAPMGDPVEIIVKGYSLALRKDEAQALLVDKEA